jgi:hypothetical protein
VIASLAAVVFVAVVLMTPVLGIVAAARVEHVMAAARRRRPPLDDQPADVIAAVAREVR